MCVPQEKHSNAFRHYEELRCKMDEVDQLIREAEGRARVCAGGLGSRGDRGGRVSKVCAGGEAS